MPRPQFDPRTRRFGSVVARTMKPTQLHRLALKQGLFGTVTAISEAGVERYFDYDWDGAVAFAGITSTSDSRVWSERRSTQSGRKALWVR